MDVKVTFKIPLQILRALGLWNSGAHTVWYYFSCLVLQILIHFSTIGYLLYLFETEDVREFSEVISVLMTNSAAIIKSLNILLRLRQIKKLLKSAEGLLLLFEASQLNGCIEKNVNRGLKSFKAYLYSAILTCTLSGLIPIVNYQQHILPYKMFIPFDYKCSDIRFILTAAWQTVTTLTGGAIVVSLDIVPVLFMCYATGFLEELKTRLDKITVNREKQNLSVNGTRLRLFDSNILTQMEQKCFDKSLNDEFSKCIKAHQMTKSFIFDIQEIFASVIMIQGYITTIILCTTVFVLSLVGFVCYFI